MNVLARMLSVEDNPNDVEMTLEAFAECRLAEEFVVVRGVTEGYELGMNAYAVESGDSPDFIESVKNRELFWALTGHPPLDSVSRSI